MSVRELLKNTTEGTLIPIVINNDTGILLLQSYFFECLIYMKAWNAEMNDSLQCKIVKKNEFDSLAVFLIHDNCLNKNLLGSFHFIKTLSLFKGT